MEALAPYRMIPNGVCPSATDPEMSPLQACNVRAYADCTTVTAWKEIARVSSQFRNSDTSDQGLANDMMALSTKVQMLCDELPTHCSRDSEHIRLPMDATMQHYTASLSTSRYIRKLIVELLEMEQPSTQTDCQPHHSEDILAAPIYALQSEVRGLRPLTDHDLYGWQKLTSWYCQWHAFDAVSRFFKELKRENLLHRPRSTKCTCDQDLVEIFTLLQQLIGKLHYLQAPNSFTWKDQPGEACNPDQPDDLTRVYTAVLPSLKIKRTDGHWTTVFLGLHVPVPQDDLCF